MKIEIDLDSLPVDVQERIYLSLRSKFEVLPLTGDALLDKEINFFRDDLENRVRYLLYSVRISTLRDLVSKRRSDLEDLRGFGPRSIAQIEEFLQCRGLSLCE